MKKINDLNQNIEEKAEESSAQVIEEVTTTVDETVVGETGNMAQAVIENQPQQPVFKKKKYKKNDEITGTLFALPPVLGFLLFGMIPLIVSLVLSFGQLSDYNIFNISFTGFQNYVKIFTTDALFLQSIGNTFIYAVASVVIGVAISLVLAVLLNKEIHFKKGFRVILFIPYVCSAVALSTMWKWIFDNNYGVLNDIMSALGIGRVDWLGERAFAMPSMIFMAVWGGLGYNMILFSAALNGVNTSYYEAAEIDGASKLRMFFSITFPLISPTTFFLVIMAFIGALQSFANFQIMTPDGGPGFSCLTMVLRVYDLGIGSGSIDTMTYASALGWLVGIIVIIFTALNFILSKKWVKYV